jgi:hypothetical protein
MEKHEREEWLPEHGSVKPEDAFAKLHKLSFRNKELLDLERAASCFNCFSYMKPDRIEEWTDNQQTAICPCCGIDSILPGEVAPPLLQEMYNRYFSYVRD